MDASIRPPENMPRPQSETGGRPDVQPAVPGPTTDTPAPDRQPVNAAAAEAVSAEAATGGESGVNKAMQHLAEGLDLSQAQESFAAQPVPSADNNASSGEGEQPRSGLGNIIPPSTPEPASNSSARTDSAGRDVTPQIQPANEQNPASKKDAVTSKPTAREATVSPAIDATDANAVARGDAGGTGAEVQNAAAQPTPNPKGAETPTPAGTVSPEGNAAAKTSDNADTLDTGTQTDTATAVPANGAEKNGGGNGGDTGGAKKEQNPGTPPNPTTPPRPVEGQPTAKQGQQASEKTLQSYRTDILERNDEWKSLRDKGDQLTDADRKKMAELEAEAADEAKKKKIDDLTEQYKKQALDKNEEWKKLREKGDQRTEEENTKMAELEATAGVEAKRQAKEKARFEFHKDALLADTPDEKDTETRRWQELAGRKAKGETLSDEEQREFAALDDLKERKAKELAKNELVRSKEKDDAETVNSLPVDVMVQASGAHAGEGNKVMNWFKSRIRKYEQATNGAKVKEKFNEYRKLSNYYKEIKHDEKFQNKEGKKKLDEFKKMVQDRRTEFAKLALKHIALKDIPLASLAFVFIILASFIYLANKMSGGK